MSIALTTFDFITDRELRASLEADYRELHVCLDAAAYKAVYVLAGSITEAVLADFLIGTGKKKPDPTRMSLENLITAAATDGALSSKTSDLAGVVRFYRNLIHPGRLKRLNEKIDPNEARIAAALVDVIVAEVAEKQRADYGFTAEQLVRKFETDPSAPSIAQHLLSETKPHELERLLLEAIPDAYFAALDSSYEESDPSALTGLSRLFRAAFAHASVATRKKVAKRFVAILKEEAGERVRVYEDSFFRGWDLEYMATAERTLVKEHLASRLKERVTSDLIDALEGIGPHLTDHDVEAIVDHLVPVIVYSSELAEDARNRLLDEFATTPASVDTEMLHRLGVWIAFLDERQLAKEAEIARRLKTELEVTVGVDLPF